MAKNDEKEKARQMRREGKSLNEIVAALKISKSSASVWVRDIELSTGQREFLVERQKQFVINLNREGKGGSQTNRKNAIQQRMTYQQEGRKHARQNDVLHEMGCMLYWAEGAKQRNSIVFVNSDANMLMLFMRFLRQCLNVPDEMIKLKLHCHTDDVEQQNIIKRYWLDLFNLKQDCFGKVMVIQGGKTRSIRHEYGLCTIDIGSTHLTMHIYGAIQEYIGIDKPEWLFVNGVRN
jgi:hypothetical protein